MYLRRYLEKHARTLEDAPTIDEGLRQVAGTEALLASLLVVCVPAGIILALA